MRDGADDLLRPVGLRGPDAAPLRAVHGCLWALGISGVIVAAGVLALVVGG